MDVTDIGLFALAERRLAWTDKRQAVLAQNIANANTPGYRAKDLAPFSMAPSAGGAGAIGLARTAPLHLGSGTSSGVSVDGARVIAAPRSPNGNGVALEDQLVHVADTTAAQELTLNLYRRYQAMFRTALGRGS